MNHENTESAASKGAVDNEQTNLEEPQMADPIELVNQQLEQQPRIDPEETLGNPAITPQMLNEGDNLRGDLKREEE